MQWSADRNAGFSQANPQKLYLPIIIDPAYHYEAVNVETQQNNPNSLLWWTKRLIARRKRHSAFGRGSLEFLHPDNPKVLAFLRRSEEETLLVVANLSRHAQSAEIDLRAFEGAVPRELEGGSAFPPIRGTPYHLSLGARGFYWFSLGRPPAQGATGPPPAELPHGQFTVSTDWREILTQAHRRELEASLPRHLAQSRWFGSRSRDILAVTLSDVVPVSEELPGSVLAFLDVEYADGEVSSYVLPLTCATGAQAAAIAWDHPHAVVARVDLAGGTEAGIVFDAFWDKAFLHDLLEAVSRNRRLKGTSGEVGASRTRAFRSLLGASSGGLEPTPLAAEQSNTSAIFGDRFVLKLFRRLDPGANPELEIGWYLTDRWRFPNVPALAGALEYGRKREEARTLALLHEFVPNQGDAFQHTLHSLGDYFERATARARTKDIPALPRRDLLALSQEEPPGPVTDAIGPYLEEAKLLGTRSAALHAALGRPTDDPAFAPEPFSIVYQKALSHAMVALADQNLSLLRRRLHTLPEELQVEARKVLESEAEIRTRLGRVRERKVEALRIRCHGDYHLGQVLFTGKDYVIIDFEGEPARPASERRIKHLPLRDVAGMIRSFHYATETALQVHSKGVAEVRAGLEPWAELWYRWVAASFLRAYLAGIAPTHLLPKDPDELRRLLDAYVLEKALYELGYELNNRPDWVRIPVRGILRSLDLVG